MNRKTLTYCIALILSAFLIFSFIQGCGSGGGGSDSDGDYGFVSGKVIDQNSEPIEGAVCSIDYDEERASLSVLTDINGLFYFDRVRTGRWFLRITKSGYRTMVISITVVTGETTEIPEDETKMEPGSDDTGDLTGEVTDEGTGLPLSDVTVSITGVSVRTNNLGIYTLLNIPAGVQRLTADKDGYEHFESDVNVTANQVNTYNFSLLSQIPDPDPGKGNIRGLVKNTQGQPLSEVRVSEQRGRRNAQGISDSQGRYFLLNLDPGEVLLTYVKNEYQQASQRAAVVEGVTTVVPVVELTQSNLSTMLVSRRVNNPQVGDARLPDINFDGSKVVFESDGNVIVDWNTPNGVFQVYLWDRSTGTIIRLSNKYGQSIGGNDDSFESRISGDGTAVVFSSFAGNLLQYGVDSGNIQVYYVDLSDVNGIRLTRVSSGLAGDSVEGNGYSMQPDINHDGTMVVFASDADNLSPVEHSPGFNHVYRAAITRNAGSITVHPRIMMDSFNGNESYVGGLVPDGFSSVFENKVVSNRHIKGFVLNKGLEKIKTKNGPDPKINPLSNQPRISADGRYAVFASMADTDITADPPVSVMGFFIYRHDIYGNSSTGWNTIITKHDGEDPDMFSFSLEPSINSNGKKIVFSSDSTFNSGDELRDIYMWIEGNGELIYVSQPTEDEKGESYAPYIDYNGSKVVFLRNPFGDFPPGPNQQPPAISIKSKSVRDAFGDIPFIICLMRDLNMPDLNYQLISKGSNGQHPNDDSDWPIISGDGKYAVFNSKATNLTNDTYRQDLWNVLIRRIEEN